MSKEELKENTVLVVLTKEEAKEVISSFAFLRSVILSNEPMTDEVRNVINDSINIINKNNINQ